MLLFAQFINKVNLFANIILPADVSFMQPLRAFLSPTWWTIFTGSIINCKTLQCNYIITFPSNTWNYWIIVLQGYTRSLPLKHQRWELLGIESVCVCVCVCVCQAWKFGKFRETIHRYRVCTPCGNNETNFRFPKQVLAETIHKRR